METIFSPSAHRRNIFLGNTLVHERTYFFFSVLMHPPPASLSSHIQASLFSFFQGSSAAVGRRTRRRRPTRLGAKGRAEEAGVGPPETSPPTPRPPTSTTRASPASPRPGGRAGTGATTRGQTSTSPQRTSTLPRTTRVREDKMPKSYSFRGNVWETNGFPCLHFLTLAF